MTKFHCFYLLFFLGVYAIVAQDTTQYSKPVLDAAEVQTLFSYYSQDGGHAAVTGGEGTEELTDATGTIVVTLPLSANAVLGLDIGISAYTSASSSNVNPLDGDPSKLVDPFMATSGASQQDALVYFNPSYQYSSEDRNTIVRAQVSVSSEYDYFSLGFGGGITKWFHEKNTSISADFQLYLDSWSPQYPIELREGFFDDRVTGPGVYDPLFTAFKDENRNTYSASFGFTQILSKRMQAALFVDVAQQSGLLSTPHQRVYLADRPDFFIDNFQLADDVEQLPDSRFKIPIGGRLNYYASDRFVFRSYYRYYWDDWGIKSHTASLEIPVKISTSFTVAPFYRYYTQTKADYFYEKEVATSADEFYTSDYDLSAYDANQYGVSLGYRDIFTKNRILMFGLKNIDLKFSKYDRSDGLNSYIISLGVTFVAD